MPLYDESGGIVSVGGKASAIAKQKAIPKTVTIKTPGGTLTGAFPNQGKEEIATAVEKEARIRAQKLQELTKTVDFFESKINEIPSGSGLWGRLVGGRTAVEAWLQTDPKAAAYTSSVNGLRAQIARGMGDVGNLSEVEQKNAVELLPKITDNEETRQQKLKNFRDFMYFKGLTSSAKSNTEKPKKTQKKTITLPSGKVITIGE